MVGRSGTVGGQAVVVVLLREVCSVRGLGLGIVVGQVGRVWLLLLGLLLVVRLLLLLLMLQPRWLAGIVLMREDVLLLLRGHHRYGRREAECGMGG